jgi:DNA mismatch endonuclease (patch repair protein)
MRNVRNPRPAASSLEARRRMQSIRQRDNQNEMRLRSALHCLGLRFRVHRSIIPGQTRTVDIVLSGARVAVFVDGCFWHSCPRHKSLPKTNRGWWQTKLAANAARDRQSDRILRQLGWRVIRVWEHEDANRAAQRVLTAVSSTSRFHTRARINSRDVRVKSVKQDRVNSQRART